TPRVGFAQHVGLVQPTSHCPAGAVQLLRYLPDRHALPRVQLDRLAFLVRLGPGHPGLAAHLVLDPDWYRAVHRAPGRGAACVNSTPPPRPRPVYPRVAWPHPPRPSRTIDLPHQRHTSGPLTRSSFNGVAPGLSTFV